MTARTPAGRLISAFGDVDRIELMLAPDVRWSLPASLPMPRPIIGREAIAATLRRIWSELYRPDVKVEILDEFGDEAGSAVRVHYAAFSLSMNGWYENEYTLFARSGPEGIAEVFESFDTVLSYNFFRGENGISFKGM